MRRRSLQIRIKRVHAPPLDEDGVRFLVDRLWPRGISKERAQIHAWVKEVAPSRELREWFGHAPERWKEFRQRYFAELTANQEALRPLRQAASQGTITLLFTAKDEERNNAVALKEFLMKNSGFPNSACARSHVLD